MQKMVARLNIEHLEHLLKSEPDGPKREMIEKLLSEERGKLRAAQAGELQNYTEVRKDLA